MRQDRLLEIVGRIYQRPETWDQEMYHCGSAHCVAGHAQNDMYGRIFTSGIFTSGFAFADGRIWLDLGRQEAEWLFDPVRTLDDLIRAAITGVCE
jgi:hypothetical protein